MAPDHVVFGLHSVAPGGASPEERPTPFGPEPDRQNKALAHVLEMSFVGARSDVQLVPGSAQEGKTNYLRGSDPTKWVSGIEGYSSLVYREVYPGIDLVLPNGDGLLSYDFYLSPGEDPKKIRLSFRGQESIEIGEDGSLHIKTPIGELIHTGPFAYQERGGAREEVASSFVVLNDSTLGFEVEGYDPTYPLVIEPTLAWSTYGGEC